MTTYSIKIKLPVGHLSELAECEHPAYEDAEHDEAEGKPAERPTATHTYVVAKRHKTILEIRNAEEANDVYYAVCSGTFGLREKSMAWHRSAVKIANLLRPYADPAIVKLWPTANGY